MPQFIDRESLDQIRQTVDWQQACESLGIQFDSERSKSHDWWGHSPFGKDKTPSFHVMPQKGVWYCFSTKQGGGIIELVQNLKDLNCFEAGQWLIDQNACPTPSLTGSNKNTDYQKPEKTDERESANLPIRQSLLPNLTEQGTHPMFVEKGISEATCHYLGCGYLAKGKSSLKERIVFQVRGVEEQSRGQFTPVILSHIGRACNKEQIKESGKWSFYAGFQKRLELYNIDRLLTEGEAVGQVHSTGHVILVEGAFDVAKLIEAGIKNVVAVLGSQLHEDVLPKIQLIEKHAAPKSFLIWFDRDKAGQTGSDKSVSILHSSEIQSRVFDWDQHFGTAKKEIPIPKDIRDPCDMSVQQLQWLRKKKII